MPQLINNRSLICLRNLVRYIVQETVLGKVVYWNVSPGVWVERMGVPYSWSRDHNPLWRAIGVRLRDSLVVRLLAV